MAMTTAEHKMAPNGIKNGYNNNKHSKSVKGKWPADIGTDFTFKRKIVWKNAIGFLIMHIAGVYGLYRIPSSKLATFIWSFVVGFAGGEGITMGAHRLYSHKSFKAKLPLRLVLNIFQTIAGQNCMYVWVRDHRQHHKFNDTDADPHNATRGFFFSHIGWLMSRKHPAVIEKGKTIDMSDLENDAIVMFQKKYYKLLYLIFAVLIPIAGPMYLFDETFMNSFLIAYMVRSILLLNFTWSVNSVAHLFGNKPFDKYILPVESAFVSFVSFGEGWHNYHHTFPWDYRAAELGSKYCLTTSIINFMAYLGQAYDLRSTPYSMIESRIKRTGDGSHPVHGVNQVSWDDRKNVSTEAAIQDCRNEEKAFIDKVKARNADRMVAVQD